MITKEEFLEIIEKHLKVRNDGSIFIDDSKLEEKLKKYLSHFASKDDRIIINKAGQPEPDQLFDGWNIYCPTPKGK